MRLPFIPKGRTGGPGEFPGVQSYLLMFLQEGLDHEFGPAEGWERLARVQRTVSGPVKRTGLERV